MFFLNSPLLLWLAPLVGLPLLIHLLNRRFPQVFSFSSIEQIKKSVAQRSRLLRWRHLLLAALRTLAILLLLLAFLKPVLARLGANPTARGARYVLILFDHSLSMEHREGALNARQRARLEAGKILDQLRPDDQLNVLAVGRQPQSCFTDFSNNHADARDFLDKLDAGFTNADFNKANAAAAQQFSSVAKGQLEIYYLSDFQRSDWADVNFDPLPAAARLFFVDVAAADRSNHAILDAKIAQPSTLAGESANVEISVANYTGNVFSDKVQTLVDGKTVFEREFSIGPWSVSKIPLPVRLGAPGPHTLEVSLPPDQLPQDDRYFLTARVLEKEEVLIVSDDPAAGAPPSADFFLRAALNPYPQQTGSILPTPLPSAALTGARLATTRKVFLTRLNPLPEPACQLLAKFINGGGGVLCFLDGAADAENLQRLDKALGGDVLPLKLAEKQTSRNLASGAQQFLRGDFRSKYLRLFKGAQRQNLSLLEFFEFYQALPTGKGNVILSYADGTPAMASVDLGLGTLLLCNFSANELASNLARQRVFPAWIQDLVKTLASEENPEKTYLAGDEVSAEIWQAELKNNSVLSPRGHAVRTDRALDGQRYRVSFTAAEPGIYRLAEGIAQYAFAVNVSPGEADLRAVDQTMLPKRLPENRPAARFLRDSGDYRRLHAGEPIFHYLLFGLIALLLAELGLFQFFKRGAAR